MEISGKYVPLTIIFVTPSTVLSSHRTLMSF
jgi:hypothetical protein